MTVAAGGQIPEVAASASVSTEAVTETLERGLLVREGSWLRWSHDLLGEVSAAIVEPGAEAAARRRLIRGMGDADLSDPDQLALAAALDLSSDGPSHDLQLAAALFCARPGQGDRRRPARRSCTACASRLPFSGTHRGAGRCECRWRRNPGHFTRLPTIAAGVDGLFETTRSVALHIIGSTGYFVAASGVIDLSPVPRRDSALRGRLESIRVVAGIMALPPEETLAAADEFLSSGDLGSDHRVRCKAPCRSCWRRSATSSRPSSSLPRPGEHRGRGPGRRTGCWLLRLRSAALFSGDAIAASQLVERGAALPVDPQIADLAVGDAPGAHDGAGPRPLPGRNAIVRRRGPRRRQPQVRGAHTDLLRLGTGATPRSVRGRVVGRAAAGPISPSGRPGLPGGVRRCGSARRPQPCRRGRPDGAEPGRGHGTCPERSSPAAARRSAPRAGSRSGPSTRRNRLDRNRPLPACDVRRLSARDRRRGSRRPGSTVQTEFRTGGFDLFAAELDILGSARLGPSDTAGRRAARGPAEISTVPEAPGLRSSTSSIRIHSPTDSAKLCSLAAAGLTNREIAQRLGISKRTVENTLHRSYIALGVDRDGLATAEL